MKNKLIIVGLIVISLHHLMFVEVPRSYAQSIQDWADPINISNSGLAYDPFLLVDGDGVFHVIWFDLLDGYKYTESADGLTWSEPKNVSYPFSPKKSSQPAFSLQEVSQPLFVADPKGAIHVFWRDKNNALFYSSAQSTSLDNPGVWGRVVKLSDSAIDFDVTVGIRGNVHLSYVRGLGTDAAPAGIFYRLFNGSQWSAPINLYVSQYFRSINPQDAHVRIAISDESEAESVYVVWDDRLQKRVFMSRSVDAGLSWEESQEVVVPEEKFGYKIPFNVEIETLNDGILLIWQSGDPGIRCTQYSQWSLDGGNQWENPIKMFGEVAICPQNNEFIFKDKEFSLLSFGDQENLSFIAWNGSAWSRPEIQNSLSSFLNPTTFDPILFGCQEVSLYLNKLFAIGCDQGQNSDIWLTSREMGSVADWFPPPSAWSSPSVVIDVPQRMSSVTSVADGFNRIHAVLVQSAASENDSYRPTIQYTRWDRAKWSKPGPIVTEFAGLPVQLTLTVDPQGRLLLGWADENGDLWFSWSNADRANVPLEWSQPTILPSPSQLNSSPDILVDAAGKIVVAYAVLINERRGIYVIRSDDFGKTWTSPILVFDAAFVGWDLVDHPRISLTEGGVLHLLFTKYSLTNGNLTPVGLIYTRSEDGGVNWSDIDVVDENSIQWNDIVSYRQSLHRLWQVRDNKEVTTYHEFSTDGGMTWSNISTISSVTGKTVQASSAIAPDGKFYFMQLVDDDDLSIQDWEWDGLQWNPREIKPLVVSAYISLLALESGITPDGHLSILALVENNDFKYELVAFERFLGSMDSSQVFPQAFISTGGPLLTPTEIPNSQFRPTITAPLVNLNEKPSSLLKNITGVVFIMIFVMIFVIVIRRGRK